VCCLFGCKKDSDEYQPPTKGNVPSDYFVETTWEVLKSNVVVPDTIPDLCVSHMEEIYFGSQTCIVTTKSEETYKGTYRVENKDDISTTIYFNDLVHGDDTCAYVLSVDELNTNRSSISLVLNVIEGNKLPRKENGNYGSMLLSK
jgi:hypothetical protein